MGGIDTVAGGFTKASGMMSGPGAPPGLSKSAAPQSTPSADGTAFVSKSKSMTMMPPPTMESKSMPMMPPSSGKSMTMMPPPTMEPSMATSKAKTSASFAFQAPVGLPTPAGAPLPDEREYVVENTLLQAPSEGMAYRSSKSWDDRADAQVNWGETVRGRDEGDGWLKVRRPSGVLYLPFKANNKLVVYQKEALVLPAAVAKTVGRPSPQAPRLPSKYCVDNSKLQAASEGLQFRGSKRWDDRAEAQIHWGEIVTGVDEGDGWLKVVRDGQDLYLPFVANNSPVLVLDNQDPLSDFYASRN